VIAFEFDHAGESTISLAIEPLPINHDDHSGYPLPFTTRLVCDTKISLPLSKVRENLSNLLVT
jgi:hypothetical protein